MRVSRPCRYPATRRQQREQSERQPRNPIPSCITHTPSLHPVILLSSIRFCYRSRTERQASLFSLVPVTRRRENASRMRNVPLQLIIALLSSSCIHMLYVHLVERSYAIARALAWEMHDQEGNCGLLCSDFARRTIPATMALGWHMPLSMGATWLS